AVFRSPSGKYSVRFEQPVPANGWGLRAVFESKDQNTVIYEIRGDAFFDFAEVAWGTNEHSFGLTTCGTPRLQMAFDIATQKEIPFAGMKESVINQIRKSYAVPGNVTRENILEWICSPEVEAAFRTKYPKSMPR
ncbi:MAG: hypothetical protein M3Z09_00800, partial [Acidobacteriota bacterium]|nr:hypothetical protein [Acidobacteriota bacterium]